MKLYSLMVGLIVSLFFMGCEPLCSLRIEDINSLYSSQVEQWQNEASESFLKAEIKVYKVSPDDNIGPHEDPKKCICKGSGVIIQGDDHVTPCPFHGKTKR
jgi:hypothetical protein